MICPFGGMVAVAYLLRYVLQTMYSSPNIRLSSHMGSVSQYGYRSFGQLLCTALDRLFWIGRRVVRNVALMYLLLCSKWGSVSVIFRYF